MLRQTARVFFPTFHEAILMAMEVEMRLDGFHEHSTIRGRAPSLYSIQQWKLFSHV